MHKTANQSCFSSSSWNQTKNQKRWHGFRNRSSPGRQTASVGAAALQEESLGFKSQPGFSLHVLWLGRNPTQVGAAFRPQQVSSSSLNRPTSLFSLFRQNKDKYKLIYHFKNRLWPEFLDLISQKKGTGTDDVHRFMTDVQQNNPLPIYTTFFWWMSEWSSEISWNLCYESRKFYFWTRRTWTKTVGQVI